MLGMITLLMPALLDQTNTKLNDGDSLTLSRICSIILLVTYLAFLVFQLKTHTYLFDWAPAPARAHPLGAAETSSLRDNESVRGSAVRVCVLSAEPRASYANGGIDSGDGAEEEEDEEEEEDILGYRGSLAWLTAITLVISVLSHYIVDTIEVASDKFDIPVRGRSHSLEDTRWAPTLLPPKPLPGCLRLYDSVAHRRQRGGARVCRAVCDEEQNGPLHRSRDWLFHSGAEPTHSPARPTRATSASKGGSGPHP